jgi:molecular chaperone GrpE
MTYDQFLGELRKFGLEQLSAEGQAFDPALHEAIATVPWKGMPEGAVLAEARKGYMLNGRLLRPVQVTVVAASPVDGAED